MVALDVEPDISQGTTTKEVKAMFIQTQLEATLEATTRADVNKEATKAVVSATPGLEATTGTKAGVMGTTRSSGRKSSEEVCQWTNTTLQESSTRQLKTGMITMETPAVQEGCIKKMEMDTTMSIKMRQPITLMIGVETEPEVTASASATMMETWKDVMVVTCFTWRMKTTLTQSRLI